MRDRCFGMTFVEPDVWYNEIDNQLNNVLNSAKLSEVKVGYYRKSTESNFFINKPKIRQSDSSLISVKFHKYRMI